MKANCYLALGASFFATAAMASVANRAWAHEIYYPDKMAHVDPGVAPVGRSEAPYVAPKKSMSGKWKDVSTLPSFAKGPWGPMQMTDGTVLVDDYCTSQWFKLAPDVKGQYTDGTWSAIAPMPGGYSPLYFAQQVLPSGNVIISGGEYYDDCNARNSDQGAMYNPVSDSWTSVTAPSGWSSIGDAQSIILPNGSYMLANCCDGPPGEQAIASISGTNVTWTIGNSYDNNWEQGYAPLPDGNVLMVDVWNFGRNYNDYEIYDTSTGTWSLAGKTADYLSRKTDEIGPAPLTPQGPPGGAIIQFSAAQPAPINDVYSIANGTWSSGPVMMYGHKKYYCPDAPAATLPDGNILVEAGSETPNWQVSHFWEFSLSSKGRVTATQVDDTKTAPEMFAFEGNLLVLPTGQVLWDNSQTSPKEVSIYTAKGKPKAAWRPVVSSVQTTLTIGSTGNAISGTNFNGFDLGGAYGDDAQAATNFPLVRITNGATGDVCFGRSYNFSTMGVWTTGTTNATFDIPTSCGKGASRLQVIVNGIASSPVRVTLD